MSDAQQQQIDLSPLEKDYDILGETNGPAGVRSWMGTRREAQGKRRDDHTAVLISVFATPAGDEGHALSHLAADTKMLAASTHRRMVPVIEGRWLGDDKFAVITQRISDPTLAQMLASGETFSNPRIAAILRDVNALLEWAREQNIVHRVVTADRILLEPKTDRVRVSFGVSPIARIRQADPAADDARTIAGLAVTMLTGDTAAATAKDVPLAALRADLPQKLRDETSKLLDEKASHSAEDVAAYLALIGMADPLFVGEEEEKRIRADILEEQRVERGKLTADRTEFEMYMAAEKKKFEQQMADERERFEKMMADERKKLEAQREELQRAVTDERARLARAMEKERAELSAKRAELEKTVEQQRAEIARVAAEDRRQIEALRAEIKRAGDLEVEKKRLAALEEIDGADSVMEEERFAPVPFAAPVLAPLGTLEFEDSSEVLGDDTIEFAPLPEEHTEYEPVVLAPTAGAATSDIVTPSGSRSAVAAKERISRRTWYIGGGIAAGVVAVVAAGALMVQQRNAPAPVAPVRRAPVVAAKPAVPSQPVALTALDSFSRGFLAARSAAAPAPTLAGKPVVDSAAGNVTRSLSTTGATTGTSAATGTPAAATPKPKPVTPRRVQRDSTARAAASTNPFDSVFTIPTTRRPRRDSATRRDTTARRDTSAARPDTTSPR